MSESCLLISDGFSVSMEDFEVQDFEIEHKPFVILNACRSGTISPLHTSNWAVLFWKRGARGVLATEFHVPDWFAASFIERLYEQMLLRKPVGESLLATRRHFWENESNPLGLGYALYSRPSIRIAN
jgi:CHAT domain-containing protein